jgi:CHAD domain-containing protein
MPRALKAAPEHTWAALREAAEAERRVAYDRLQNELDGPAVTSLVLALAAESEKEPGASALLRKSARKPLLVQAPKMLDRVARKAVKRGRGLKHRSEHEVHTLRKALKKLRYSTEFLGSLYGHDKVKSYVHHCKELQEGLGAANDASVAASLAEKLGKTDLARLRAPGATLVRWSHEHRRCARHRSVEGWREFKKAAPFWAARGDGTN